ncbi:MAG: glycosyl hydrolase 53 family protein [Bacteroidota bacterium]
MMQIKHLMAGLSLSLFMLSVCQDTTIIKEPAKTIDPDFKIIRALDLSTFPEMEVFNPALRDSAGNPIDFLSFIQQKGVNCIRLRLWIDPPQLHSVFDEVRSFAERLRFKGFHIWLALHYSETWADPGQQEMPSAWQELQFSQLRDSVYQYTFQVLRAIKPEIAQLGNEINNGFLFPQGSLSKNPQGFLPLLEKAVSACRVASPESRVLLHYAGIGEIAHFLEKLERIDYDILGISYYPLWHGKNLTQLSEKLEEIAQKQDKDLLIAETAYPFTLEWNDWTHNIIGQEQQLILPDFPASPLGQKDFLNRIREIIEQNSRGIGFCYWGGEWVAFKGSQAEDGSPWENQALFDFDHRALPAWEVFEEK